MYTKVARGLFQLVKITSYIIWRRRWDSNSRRCYPRRFSRLSLYYCML